MYTKHKNHVVAGAPFLSIIVLLVCRFTEWYLFSARFWFWSFVSHYHKGTITSLRYFVMFQPLCIGALSVISLVGTSLVWTWSCSAPRNSASLLSLELCPSVIFKSYPTKLWALVSPLSIAGVLKKIWSVSSALFSWRRLRAEFGDLNCLWRCDDWSKIPSWVVCLNVRQTISASTFRKYLRCLSQSSRAGCLILDFKGAFFMKVCLSDANIMTVVQYILICHTLIPF